MGQIDEFPHASWCNMPNLDDLNHERFNYLLLKYGIMSRGALTYQAASFSKSFVRLVDKAILEYKHARCHLVSYVRSFEVDPKTGGNAPKLGTYITAAGHFENIVTTLHRLQGFSTSKEGPKRPHSMQVFSNDAKNRIKSTRNLIEHTDGKIIKGEIAEGSYFTIKLCDDLFGFAGYEITYAELADWLKELYDFADVHINFEYE